MAHSLTTSRAELELPHPTPEGVEKFAQLYRERFGKELSPAEALELATSTVQFVYLCVMPCPENNPFHRNALTRAHLP